MPNGSGGSRFNEMARIWSENGHDITVLSGMIYHNSGKKYPEYVGKKFAEEIHSEGVRVIRCHDSEGSQDNFISRLKVYFVFVITSIWAGVFKVKGKYDIIIVTSPPLTIGLTAYVISKIKKVPFVFEIRDLWPESAIDTGVLANKWIIKLSLAFEAFIYKKAKRINVLTPAFNNTLLVKKGVPSEKLMMIPNAADFALSDNLLQNFDSNAFRKANLLENHFVITYVGAHGVANHLDQVLDAAEVLADTNVLFLLVGEGMEKARLVSDAKRRGLINVRFIDPVPKQEVFKYILASDMGASILKRVDTFKTVYSNKTFDYFSCKKPVLMAIDGVSRELVEDANAGVYVEPENISAYNATIREYLKDPQRLIQEGENGYQFAKSNFDRQLLAEKYINELIETLKR